MKSKGQTDDQCTGQLIVISLKIEPIPFNAVFFLFGPASFMCSHPNSLVGSIFMVMTIHKHTPNIFVGQYKLHAKFQNPR